MRMLLWHKPLSVCKSYSSARFRFSSSRGERAPFLLSPFFVTKRAARFRRVALKKLLSVFAEQPLCLPWHIYIIPHPFAKINTILSNFVQIRPHLSKFVQPALGMLYPQAGSHFRQKVIRLAQNSFLHVAHRRARCLLIRTIGEIGQCRQCIVLIIIFRHKPLFLLQQCSHNCFMQLDCPQMRSNLFIISGIHFLQFADSPLRPFCKR